MRFLYLHGFASGPSSSKAQWFRERFSESGTELEVLQLDEGDFEHLTISGQLRMIDLAAKGEAVSLMGSSMGGYLAALYASAHQNVHRLVLLAPAFQFARRWPETLGETRLSEWKRTGAMEVFHYGEARTMKLRYDLLEDAEKFDPEPSFEQPALIYHGSRDDVVPVGLSEQYAATRRNVRLRVLDSDHQLTDVVETIWAETASFLLE